MLAEEQQALNPAFSWRAMLVAGNGRITGLSPRSGSAAVCTLLDDADTGTVCRRLEEEPLRVAWVRALSTMEDLPRMLATNLSHLAQQVLIAYQNAAHVRGNLAPEQDYAGKWLLNHDAQVGLSFDQYRSTAIGDSIFEPPILHPLPLLTAWSNGECEADYRGENEAFVGSWMLARIAIATSLPEGYEQVAVQFPSAGNAFCAA